ncbi:uncharacterized protein LOC143427196 [Xylocopa sonorina]|uniref:uncharacterized protein LOC143427196 n=1 Tax=Xylocopa sonorina TaxID=1818115 RepID=UPI00403A8594
MDWENRTVSLLFCLSILLATIHDGNAERKIVCYYTNWSIYRPGTAKFSPQNINPYLCTHLIYAFGGFTKDNTLKPFDKYQDIEKGGYAKFTGLKTYNKNLKTLLAIGGWNEGSSRFSPMVADPDRRREFVKNAIKFLRKNHFDGLDLDWEYPAFRDGGKPRDKDNYASLVQELREEFERESSKTGRPRLLLTLAMPAGIEYIDKGYDIPRLDEYLDFVNLLSYDYHSSYEPAVNHHSPLYPLEEDNEYNYDSKLTIDYTINYLLKKGASAEKIILGIPTYGRSYTLYNQDATDLGSPADGPGVEGDASREKGYLAYYEICESLGKSDEWEVIQPNPDAMGPYAFKDDQWVGYDDENIVRLKARYANEKNLGGIMFWTIDNDDFRGKCHDRPYPLIEAAKETLLAESTNTVQKSKTADHRKKPRTQGGQSNAIGRKVVGSRRSTTTAAPVTKKRVFSSRPKHRTLSRPRVSDEEEEEEREVGRRSYDSSSDEEESSEGGNAVRTADKNERASSKNRNRPKARSNARSRRKPARRRDERNDSGEESLSNRLTTPEPPTTPDPGTDFKCEDEGFFSHPRDCKKYFWCLDSGPGGLGVVAHQFTCPSGLVFNKAADSCDYPRNVVCPKSKTSQTTASTTRAPITAATSRTTYLYSTTRRPTTEKPDSEEEYEYYDEDDEDIEEEEKEEKKEPKVTTTPKTLLYKTITRNRGSSTTTTTEAPSTTSKAEKVLDLEDEEDPRVIKELIKLIKKAGGLEELEKQLLLQEKNTEDTVNSNNENATPATISRTLYERVLNRQASKTTNKQRGSTTNTNYANGPGKAQFEGLDEVPEVKTLRRSQKPQYVTIERPKPSKKEPPVEDEDADEDEELDDDNTDVASSEEQTISNPFLTSSTQRATPNYVNIRRSRPSTSRNENDVEEKRKNAEEEAYSTRRHHPDTSSKNTEANSAEDTRDPEPRPSTSKGTSQTTKFRYVSVQRFRSTTPQSTKVTSEVTSSSQEPTTESVVSSEAPVTQNADVTTTPTTTTTTTTTPSINVVTSIILSSTPNDILVQSETEKSVSTATPEPSSITTESVRLVENSATEILLTTVPASLSTLSVPNTRISTASVSQPRPFGFNRRNRPTIEPATTPLPAANDQTRSKVSISSRNNTRSPLLVGRGRLRPKQDGIARNEPSTESEQIESSPRGTVDDEPARSRGRSRTRGFSRYTPPSYKPRNETASDTVVRERARTTESPVSATVATDAPKRRFRRPTARVTAESSRANELEDSPIVRIAPSSPRRSLSSRSRNTVKDETESEKVTNIKVFNKPATLNRDVYTRTRYTRKRNNLETSEPSKQAEVTTEKTSDVTPTLWYPSTTASTIGLSVNLLNDTVTEEANVNSVDEVDGNLNGTTVAPEKQETTISSDTETNTVESVRTTESILESELTTVTNVQFNSTEGLDEVLTSTSESINVGDPDPTVISSTFPTNSTYTTTEGTINAVPKRRRVLLRRRLVTPATITSQEEEEENKLIPRRRKVIKRIRPVQSTASTIDVPSSTQEEQILLNTESTTPIEDQTSTASFSTDTETLDASTESLSTLETAGTVDYGIFYDSTSMTFETPTAETAMSYEDLSDPDVATMASTIVDNITTTAIESSTEPEESITGTAAMESTTSSNFVITLPDRNSILDETLPSNDQLETLPTTISTTTPVVPIQSNRRLETYNTNNRTAYTDSRYVRKKFVRKRPVTSSEDAIGQNPITGPTTHVLPLASERSDFETASKRRKSLFVRRRPVSSTTTRTTLSFEEDSLEDDKFSDEKDLRLEEEQHESTDATLRIHRAQDETLYPINLSTKSDSAEFWNRYTTASTTETPLFSVLPEKSTTIEDDPARIEDEDDEAQGTVPSSNRPSDLRPRYRVPDSLKKIANTEGLYSSESSSEQSDVESNSRTKYQNFRQPKTRYKYREITRNRGENHESIVDATESPSLDSSTHVRTRFYARRPVSTTEPPVTETLIPAKKFDYAADAYRRQQSLRTTPRNQNEDTTIVPSSNEEREVQNFVDADYVTTISPQPLITRLVTSVKESATTERQKILIKTKYSSLTSTTKIPIQTTVARVENPATTPISVLNTLERSMDPVPGENEDESVNEIRQGQVERSTLPIEGEFLYQARFTTESHESSTIEIESVASADVNRLPTLKELIGYRTNDFVTSSPSPILLSLLPLKGKEEEFMSRINGSSHVLDRATIRDNAILNDTETEHSTLNKYDRKELDLSADSNSYYVEDNIANVEDESSLTNKKRFDREDSLTTTIRPTTMRGAPLVNLLHSQAPRGFYVTRSETKLATLEKVGSETIEQTTKLPENNEDDASVVTDRTEQLITSTKSVIDFEQTATDENLKSSIEVSTVSNSQGTKGRVTSTISSINQGTVQTEKSTSIASEISLVVSSTEYLDLEENVTHSTSTPIINATLIRFNSPITAESRRSSISKSIDFTTENLANDYTTLFSGSTDSMTTASSIAPTTEVGIESETITTELTKSYSSDKDIYATQTERDENNSTNGDEESKSTTLLSTITPRTSTTANLTKTQITQSGRTDNKSNHRRQKIGNNSGYEFGRKSQRRGQTRQSVKPLNEDQGSIKNPDRAQLPRRRVISYKRRLRKPDASTTATINGSTNNRGKPEIRKKPAQQKFEQTETTVTFVREAEGNNSVLNLNDREGSNEEEINEGKELIPKANQTGNAAVSKEERLRIEENIDRFEPEVNSSKNTVTTRTPGNLPSTRLRKPTTHALTPPHSKTSNTLANHRNTRPKDGNLTHVNEKLDAADEITEVQKSEKDIDQSSKAQEIAVTLADPPSSQTPATGRPPLRNALRRKISTTVAPRTDAATSRSTLRFTPAPRNRQSSKAKDKSLQNVTTRPRRPPVVDYDYYEDEEEPVVGKSTFNGKLYLTSTGTFRCLDQGNFPHPYSCKKFITCARMVNGLVVGAEYTCPDKLSFDPVGGICNWSAGLGCKE